MKSIRDHYSLRARGREGIAVVPHVHTVQILGISNLTTHRRDWATITKKGFGVTGERRGIMHPKELQ